MKKTFLVAVLVLLSLLLTIHTAEANPFPFLGPGLVFNIQTPSNATYALPIVMRFSATGQSNIYLRSDIGDGGGSEYSGDFYYVLDGQNMKTQAIKIEDCQMKVTSDKNYTRHVFTGQTLLCNLTQGTHNVTIFWGVPSGQGILNMPNYMATAQFTVSSSGKMTEDSSLIISLATITTLIVIIGCLLVFFKKCKPKTT
jgi:hypothetical protein